jgi:tetratricopeptide (TPR) repeat protein
VDTLNSVPNKQNPSENPILKEKLERFLNSHNFQGGLDIMDEVKDIPTHIKKSNDLSILSFNAEATFKMKEYQKTIELLSQFIEQSEGMDKAVGYQKRALAYYLSCNKVYAHTDYKNYLSELVKVTKDDFALAEIYRLLKDFDNAIKHYDLAKTKLNLYKVFIGKAIYYQDKKKHFEADHVLHQGIEEISTHIKQNPCGWSFNDCLFWGLYESRSHIYSALRKYDLALSDINRALVLWDLKQPNPYYAQRAQIYAKRGDYNKAAADIQKANEITFNSSMGYLLQQANIYLKLCNFALALQSYTDALHAAKNDDINKYKALTGLANIHRKLDQIKEADEYSTESHKLEGFTVLLDKYHAELESLI